MNRLFPTLALVACAFLMSCDEVPTDVAEETAPLFKKGGNKPGGGGGGEATSLTGTDIGTLGGDMVQVEGISPEGWIVGYADTDAGLGWPFLWRDGTMEALPLPERFTPFPGIEGYTSPVLINNQKMMIGAAPDPDRPNDNGFFSQTPLTWTLASAGTWSVQDLPVPVLLDVSDPGSVIPRAMNDAGMIVADVREPHTRPVIWDPGATSWSLLGEPAGALWTRAVDLNALGITVGYSRMYDWGAYLYDAVVWKLPSPDPIALPRYLGSDNQQAHAINEAGEIIGFAQTGAKRVVVRWTPQTDGSYVVERVEALGDGFHLMGSTDINSCNSKVAGDMVLAQDGTLYGLESLFRRGETWDLHINDDGWIAGTSAARVKGGGAATETRGTLWQLPNGC